MMEVTLKDIYHGHFIFYVCWGLKNSYQLCDMIKGNESDVANIDFEL